MSIISYNSTDEVTVFDCIQRFFSSHQVGTLLKKCNGTKEKGVPAISLLKYKLGNIFLGRSMYMQQRTGSFKEDFSKNTFYRFLNSTKTNWLRFTSLLSSEIINHEIKNLTDENRANVFIVDDTLFERTSCKKTELGARVFDHVGMKFRKGFRLLTLGWSDGNTFMPVNSCLLSSAKESNLLGPTKTFDQRTIAGKRRKLAQMKAPDAMIQLLKEALGAGHSADYVLFDCWFANPAQITAVKSMDMDVIAMVKKSSRIQYLYDGQKMNIKQIYARNRKRRGRSKYLLSVNVMVGKENPIPAKIVCVRNKANRKDWLAFVCTNPELSEEEIIRIYGKRWQIEVFFKTCKSTLNLIGECHSLSYDALTAHVAIVFTRYMLLSLEQRKSDDQRTLGEFFFFLVDEMADITFARSLSILMDALLASLQEILKLSDVQLETFTADFVSKLPEYLQNALKLQISAAQVSILLAEILNFQGAKPIWGMGSLSYLYIPDFPAIYIKKSVALLILQSLIRNNFISDFYQFFQYIRIKLVDY